MPIEFSADLATFREVVTVDEAEGLLEWLQQSDTAQVDLSACQHLHPANLQVLMARRTGIAAWPDDAALRAWLQSTLICD